MVDKNKAPDGYIAIPSIAGCGCCAFSKVCTYELLQDREMDCTPDQREDGENVVFKRREGFENKTKEQSNEDGFHERRG